MYKTENFNKAPFDELREFLHEKDISFSEYQAYEYFVRDALENFSSASSFPDEGFKTITNASSLRRVWEKFKNDHAGAVDWGFHPLVTSLPNFQEKLKDFHAQLGKLLDAIPADEEYQELNLFRLNVKKEIHSIRRKANSLDEIASKTKFFRSEETAYLFASRFMAFKLLSVYGIEQHINEFIHLKYKCYFQDSEVLAKDAVISRLRHFQEQDRMKKHLEKYCKSDDIYEVLMEFARSKTAIPSIGRMKKVAR